MAPRTTNWFLLVVDGIEVDRLVLSSISSVSPQQMALFLGTRVRQYFRQDIIDRFESRGDAKSGAWPWLSDATQEIRSRQGFNPTLPINVRRGELFETLINRYMITTTGGDTVLQMPGSTLNPRFEEKLETAQRGSNSNPVPNFGPTPPRPAIAVNSTDLAAILTLLQRHVMEFIIATHG